MTDLGVVHWIRGLDENGAVGLARALILAEAGLHGLPLDEFSMSGRVKAGDGGIDGTTQFPEFLGERIPTGSCVWQVKSGATRPSAAKELDTARHAPLADAIRQGADYVLFWTGDQVSPVSDAVRDEFRNAVQEIRAGAEIHFLFAEGIERLCLAHLGVLAQASPFPLSGLVSLVRWGFPSKFRDVAFQADARRSQAVDVIRAHVSTFDVEPYELHIFGDTGVGKSRLVYEALAIPGLQERVLVAPDATQFERSILTHVASSDDRRLVLVVDDCDSENRASLSKYTGMAEGRIRLVTIGPRWTREQPSMDARRIEVLPLEAGASKQIAQSVGLGDRDADLVAAYTEGYPGLAFTLAKAIYHGVGPESLVARVRGHEEVGSVLASLVPPDDVPTLGLLALFEKLGFDGDLAQELTVVCRTLDVDEPSVRRVADRELGRFVSTAGRFRRVSPRLFAVWLATKLLSTNKSTLTTALAGLPGSLRDRIVSQIQDFAGDAVVDEVLAELLAQPPFADGALADVDEGAGRLLHVAAIASPNSAMDAIERLLSGTTDEDVRLFGAGRRETVWALEVLLWFEEHFQRAADALLRLALGENEQWANNATGVLQGAFRVFLGGTGAPFEQRLAWAQGALDRFGARASGILLPALGHALESHESRSVTHFGGRTAPQEWRPQTRDEELAARGGAWNLLIEVAKSEPSSSDEVARILAKGIRTALRRGLSDRVLRDLRLIQWSATGRGALGDAVSKALKYDNPHGELETELRLLESDLRGRELRDRVDYAFSLSPWQLGTDERDEMGGVPRLVREIAADLATAPYEQVLDIAQDSPSGVHQTVGMLFAELARLTNNEAILLDIETLSPLPEAALLGVLHGLAELRDERWVDAVLDRWLGGPLGGLVVSAARLLPTTDHRAGLAVAAVDLGLSAPATLGAFLYGAWARSLTEPALLAIVSRLASVPGAYELEHALGIVDQWMEGRDPSTLSAEFRSFALQLLDTASRAEDGESTMVSHHRSRILAGLDLSFDDLLRATTQVMLHLNSFADSDDLELLDMLVTRDPARALEEVVRLVGTGGERFSQPWLMWLEHSKVLSRIERATQPDAVIDAVLAALSPAVWPQLVGHIDLSSDEPDPLLRSLLERSDDPILHSRAAFAFGYPESGWTGPESSHLRSRRETAERWKSSVSKDSGFYRWLVEVARDLDRRTVDAEQEEAERGF